MPIIPVVRSNSKVFENYLEFFYGDETRNRTPLERQEYLVAMTKAEGYRSVASTCLFFTAILGFFLPINFFIDESHVFTIINASTVLMFLGLAYYFFYKFAEEMEKVLAMYKEWKEEA